jgi:hypothetical protein
MRNSAASQQIAPRNRGGGHVEAGNVGGVVGADPDRDQYPRAFEEFANIKTPSQLLTFVATYGPLSFREHKNAFDVILLLDQAKQMHDCMHGKQEGVFARNLSAKNPETGELEISVTPTSLLEALWLQLHCVQSSGAVPRTCPYCHDTFTAGGSSGRLRHAQFCSPECRTRFNSLARSDPKMRQRRIRGRHK